MHALLENRSSDFKISKVKGHATAIDVAEGRVAPMDKHGNDAADALARAGAATHALPSDEIHAVKHRYAVTRSVQQMMVEILEARAANYPSEASSDSSSCNVDSSSTCSTESSASVSEGHSEGHVVSLMQAQVPLHSGSNHPT